MIPKTLHRVVPRKQTELMNFCWNKAKELHPDWQHVTHYDDESYSEINDILSYNIPGAIKADLIRYYVLYNEGGIYLDSDYEPYRSLSPLLANSAFAAYESEGVLNQAVIGCKKNHESMSIALSTLISVIKQGRLTEENLIIDNNFPIKLAPGPYSITMAFKNRLDVTKLEQKSFYPYIPWDSRSSYSESFKADPGIYGIHWYVKTWGPKHWTLPESIDKMSKSFIDNNY